LIVAFSFSAQAQTPDSLLEKNDPKIRYKNPEGTEFWLCFEKNFREPKGPANADSLFLELFISSNQDASVSIDIEGIGFNINRSVPKGQIVNVKIPVEAQILSEEIIEKLAVHVKADKPISVYGLNRRRQTTDTYLGLPKEVLGNEYRTMCYTLSETLMSQFAIVGVDDSTEVEITNSVNSTKHPAKIPYKVRLNKGEVYQVIANYEPRSTCDLTGSLIKANKNISVFSGHQCAYVTPRIIACNHLVEQMPPISSWGKQFYIGMLKARSMYTYRVLANENDTKIFEDNKLVRTLAAGEFYESNSAKNVQISATKPVLVAQYSQGFRNGDSIGDPMMIMVSPTKQFLKYYRFATPVSGKWRHYVNVVIPTKAISTLRLDGDKIDSSRFAPLGLSIYSIAYIEVKYGSHVLEGDLPFGMYSYGFGFDSDGFDAYGTMGGQSFVEYETAKDTLAPYLEYSIRNSKIKVIARDDRIEDSGLKRVEVQYSEGFKIVVPKIEEGTPQIQFSIEPEDPNKEAKALITIFDAALNAVSYTACNVFDRKSGQFVTIFAEGAVSECKPAPGVFVGAYIKPSIDIYSAGFSKTDKYNFKANFDSPVLSDFSAGLYVGTKFWDALNLSATLSLDKYSGDFTAKGGIDSVRDKSSMKLIPFQEGKILRLNGLNLHLGLRAEHYFSDMFYGLAGLEFAVNLSNDVTIKDRIYMPSDFAYADGARDRVAPGAPKSLSSINFLRFGAILGCGANFKISGNWYAFGEANITLPAISIVNDASWYLFRGSLLLGLKYRI
jgi:hypothetical protein